MPQISDREIGLIKGLAKHTALNNQQILAIFSQIQRDLNSRDIGYIKSGTKPRYKHVPAASKFEIDQLLFDASKIAALTEKLGIGQREPVEKQVYKAIDLMRTAISIFNSNAFENRSEAFIVIAIISWTYLLHAKIRSDGSEPVYLKGGKPVLVDGKERLWDLSKCIKVDAIGLSDGVRRNLKYLIAVRNEVEHRSTDDINDHVQAKCHACALNFLNYCRDQFGAKFDFSSEVSFAIQLKPLTMKSKNLHKDGGSVSGHIEAVNALLEGGLTPEQYNDPDYAFRVHVVPNVTNNPNKADQVVTFSPIGSNVEMAIKHVERPKYRQTEMLSMLRKQGKGLTAYQFQKIWKEQSLKDAEKGLAVQLGGQWFWYPEALKEFIKEVEGGGNG